MRSGQAEQFEPRPLVSVVIPAFNRAILVTRALESVKAQTHRPLEVVVVDDGSTDETYEVVQKWCRASASEELDCRVVCQSNSGASAARNVGISSATGDYIAFLDSDDEWVPTKISHQLTLFATAPELEMVYTGEEKIYEDGRRIQTLPSSLPTGIRGHLRLNIVPGGTSSSMLRRDVLARVGGFDESLPARQDYELWLRVMEAHEVAHVNESLVTIHVHGGSERISNDLSRRLEAREAVFQKHRPTFEREGMVAEYHWRTGWLCQFRLDRKWESATWYARAIRANPSHLKAWLGLASLGFPTEWIRSARASLPLASRERIAE